MALEIVWFCFSLSLVTAVRELPYINSYKDGEGQTIYEMTITSPEMLVNKADEYVCFTKYLEELGEVYILRSEIEFDHKYVHHVAISFCEDLEDFALGNPWECSLNRGKMCRGSAVSVNINSDFEKSNGVMKYPKGISLKVGSQTNMKYLDLETHFKGPVVGSGLINVTLTFIKVPTRYNFQTELFMTTGYIPANVPNGYFAEIACPWNKPEIKAFAVSLHTHHYGHMGEFYRIRNRTWTLLSSQLTQGGERNIRPVIGGIVDIKPGDILAAKCLYINKSDKMVKFGQADGEEMCNADLLYGYDFKYEEEFKRTGACVTDLPGFTFCNHKETADICATKFS